jgi:hypothetical protein
MDVSSLELGAAIQFERHTALDLEWPGRVIHYLPSLVLAGHGFAYVLRASRKTHLCEGGR